VQYGLSAELFQIVPPKNYSAGVELISSPKNVRPQRTFSREVFGASLLNGRLRSWLHANAAPILVLQFHRDSDSPAGVMTLENS